MPTYINNPEEWARNSSLFEVKAEDEEYLVSLAKQKGYEDSFIYSIYVVVVANTPVLASEMGLDDSHSNFAGKFIVYSEDELKKWAKDIDRFFYDEKNKRLMGFLPPTSVLLEKTNDK